MLQIVLPVALPPVPLYDVLAPPLLTLDTRDHGDIDEMVDELGAACTRAAHTLLIVPSWLDPATRVRLRTARRLLQPAPLSLVEVHVPPLALSVLARQLTVLSEAVAEPSRLASATPLLTRELVIGACLSSISGYPHGSVPLHAHLSSYLPWTAFVAMLGPAGGVARATAWRPPASTAMRRTRLLHGRPGTKGTGWARAAVALHLGASTAEEVPQAPQAAAWWGSRRVVEFVAAIEDPQELLNAVLAAPARPCQWCGATVIGNSCPFCAMAAPHPAAPTGHAPQRTGPACLGSRGAE
ncbi:hypothetical protein [Kitasatospora sp. NPDC059571]|uniref:hypothetical protein n=1 Tax=Kitasatospora sp. NPDC059571 TaxID=3346871 RepID=UPI0036BD9F53